VPFKSEEADTDRGAPRSRTSNPFNFEAIRPARPPRSPTLSPPRAGPGQFPAEWSMLLLSAPEFMVRLGQGAPDELVANCFV